MAGLHMASTDEARGGALRYLPPVWLGVVMVLSAWGLWSGWPLLFEPDVGGGTTPILYAALGFSLFTLLFGGWLQVLFARGSATFPRSFIIWQSADIAWLILYQVWAFLQFGPILSGRDFARLVAEIAIGLFCIAILLRQQRPPEPLSRSPDLSGAPATALPAQPPGPTGMAQLLSGLLGFLLGGAAGLGIGLLLGAVIADVAEISCFEGGCGFFALFVGLAGLLVGAVAGPILAVWWVRRRR